MLSSESYTLRLPKTAGYFSLLLGLWTVPFASQKSFAATNTFNFTGGAQTFTVPPTVTNITVTLTGASGGSGGNDGGSGGLGGAVGQVTGTLAVTPGQAFTVFIGSAGGGGSSSVNNTGGGSAGSSGGAPLGGGGGRGGNAGGKSTSSWWLGTTYTYSGGGGGGGGAAWLYRSTNIGTTNIPLAVASGGGGGGGAGAGAGLNGNVSWGGSGSTTGQNGTDRGSSNAGGGGGGGGGGYTAGGAGGGLVSSGDTDSGGLGGGNGANYTNGLTSPTSTSLGGWSGNAQVQFVYNGLPNAPTISGTSDLSRVTLSWTAPASALTITDYIVQYRLGSSGSWTTFSDGTSGTPGATVTGLTSGSAYQFQVAAVNSDGTGPYSSPVSVTVNPNLNATFASAATVPVTVNGLTAAGVALTVNLGYAPLAAQKLTLVNNTGTNAISGTFTSLAQGAEVTATYNGDTFKFTISYTGGTGNDIVLTRTSDVGGGVVSTVAGSGAAGSANGTGTAAAFHNPGTTAVDANGNIYVADTANHVIRKIDSNGAVTTLAGTAGSAGSNNATGATARFSSPAGIVVDSTGTNLYVADTGNHQIRRIVASTGVVTTVAGSTTSGTTDATGTSARFLGPKALAINSAGTELFVADSGNHRIRKVVISSGVVTTIAGSSNGFADGNGTAAQFSNPSGIAVDSTGAIWVADTDNARIRKVTSASPFTVSTVVDSSGGLAGFTGGGEGGNLIRNGNFQSGNTNFTSAYGYIAPAARALYKEGLYSVVAQASQVHDAFSTSFDKTLTNSSGRFFVANAAPDTTKTVWQSMPIGVSQANSPYRFEAYITKVHGDNPPSLVFEIGNGTTWQSLGTTASLIYSSVGAWVFTFADGRFSQPGVFYVRLQNNNSAAGGNDLGVDDIYFGVRTAAPSIGFTPGSTSVPSYNVAGISGILMPVGITVDGAGNLYVTDAAISRIRKFENYGAGTNTFLGSTTAGWQDGPSATARFYNPNGVAVDPLGNLIVADSGNQRIRQISNVTPFTPVLTLGAGQLGTNGVTVSGTVNPNGFITTASFVYGTTESNLNQTAAVTLPGANNGSSAQNVSANLGNLAVGTYYYRLTATNVDGTENTDIGTFTVSPRWNTATANFASASSVPVTSAGMSVEGATFNLTLGFAPGPGGMVTLLNNTSASPISGTFAGLPQGSTVTAAFGGDTFTFQINYAGGDGNDITLSRVGGPGQIENVIVSTLAGTGLAGYLDGPGGSATFSYPFGIAADSAGNLYVADNSNSRIRKITPAGVVSTLAGGTINRPLAVAVDSSGNVYVPDHHNARVLKISPAGVVSTLAGGIMNGGVALDSSGNVYVTETSLHVVLKITPAGTVTSLAGNNSSGFFDATGSAARFNFTGATQPAVDSAGNVYVADPGNHRIRKITPAGVVTTVAGTNLSGAINGTGTGARFFSPGAVAIDAAGNLLVADTGNHLIRKITPAGVVSTLAGSGTPGMLDGAASTARFHNPGGVTVDAAGVVYVPDSYNHQIRKLTADFRPILSLGAASQVGSDLRLTGTVNPNGFITTARFEYGTNSTNLNLSTNITLSPNNATNALALTNLVSGLTPNITNFFRLTASNVDGVAVTTNGSFRLLPPSTVTFASVGAKTYGDDAFTISATSSGGSTLTSQITYTSSDTNVATVVGNLVTIRGAGPVTITASHPATGSAGPGNGTLSLNIAKVTLTARAANLAYPAGQALPAFGLVYAGFVNGDSASVLDSAPSVSSSPASPTTAGTYTLTAAGGSDNNYSFSYATGTLTLLNAGGKIPLISASEAPINVGSFSGSGWTLDVDLGLAPGASQVLTLVNNLGSSPVTAPFANLAEGDTFTTTFGGDSFSFRISYTGGDGNDVTLTRLLKPGQTPVNYVSTLAGSGATNRTDGATTNAAFLFDTQKIADPHPVPNLKLNSSGNLIVRETYNSSFVRVVTPSGQVSTVSRAPIYTGNSSLYSIPFILPSPWSASLADEYPEMVSDTAGNAYFYAGRWDFKIRRVTPAGVVSVITNGSYPLLAMDASGHLYLGNNYKIDRIASNGATTTLTLPSGVSWINGLAVGPAGEVHASGTLRHGIWTINSSNQVSRLVGDPSGTSNGYRDGPASQALVNTPAGIAVDPAGVVYFIDAGNQRIRKVAPAAPPIVTLAAAAAHTATNAAVFSGTVNPNGYITTARFEYGTNSTNLNLSTNVAVSPNNGTNAVPVSAVIPDLNVSATYHFRLTAVNVDGSVSSQSSSFRRSSLRTPSEITWAPFATTNFTYPLMAGSSFTDLPLSATSSSGLGVIFQISPQGSSGGQIVSGSGSSQGAQFNAPGTYTITAVSVGNSVYDSAPSISRQVTVAKGSLEVQVADPTWGNMIRRPYGQPNPALPGVAFVGNVFAYDTDGFSGTPGHSLGGLFGVNGTPGYTTTATLTSLPGIYPITLTPGNLSHAKYDFTYSTNALLVVTAPTINFNWGGLSQTYNPAGILPPTVSTDPAGLNATLTYNGSSNLPTAPGTYTVVATATDPDLGLTSTSTNTYTVAKATPTINFAPIPSSLPLNQLNNVAVSATASGGVGVTLSLDANSAATLSGTLTDGTGTLGSVQSTGTVYLRATTAETANYASTTQLFTIDVTKNNQTITFSQNLPDITFAPSTSITLAATTTGPGSVAYTVTGPATLSGNTLTITGAGEVTVTADQSGDGATAAAPSVARSFNVAKATNPLTFDLSGLPAPTFGDSPIDLSAYLNTLPAGATRELEVVSGPATISGTMLTLTGAGPVVIRAVQPENDKYLAATPVEQTISVGKKSLTIAAVSTNRPAGQDNPAFAVNYTGRVGSDPLQVPPTVTANADATSAPGTYTITPANASDANYTIAYTTGTLTVQQASPTLTWNADTNSIVYGTPLTSAQLGASAGTIAGTISYTVNGNPVALGGILPTGTNQVVATFTPADTTAYATVTQTNPLVISPRTIQILADEQGKVAGANDPTALTYRVVGSLVAGDSLTGSLGRDAGNAVGSYNITIGSLAIAPSSSASNYDLQFTGASFTVSVDPLAVIRDYTGSNTAPAEADYTAAGITGVDSGNLAAINSAFTLLGSAESDSAPEIQNVVDSYNRILAEANGSAADANLLSNPSADDYTNIGVNLGGLPTTAGGLSLLNDVVGAQSASGVGSVVGQVQALVNVVDALMRTAGGLAVSPALTDSDLTLIGLTGVTSSNLSAILSAIGAGADDGSGISTLSSLQAFINAYNVILASADGSRDGDDAANANQYALIGVTGVTSGAGESLLGDVIDGSASTAVDTVAEIQGLADAVAGVLAGAAGTANEPTLADLTALGITGATSGNLAAIQAAIAATAESGSGVATISDLQGLVDGAINALNALAVISGYTGSNTAPTTLDYGTAGITGVTADNLAGVNSIIGPLASGATDTVAKMQGVVDAFLRIFGEANGSAADLSLVDPSEADYLAVGVTLGDIAGNANGLSLLNDALGDLASSSADSLADLNALASLIDRLLDTAAGRSVSPALTPADFLSIGLSGVTNSTLASVLTAIGATADNGSGIATISALQGVIDGAIGSSISSDLAIITAYNGTQTGAGIPAVTTYENAGVNGVSAGNLSAINDAIAGLISSDKYLQSQVQGIVNSYNRIFDQANGSAADSDLFYPLAADYTGIGVNLGALEFSSGGLYLLNDVVGALTGPAVDTVAEIQALVEILDRLLITAAGGTPSPALTAANLATMGITGVTTSNLPAFLSAVAATADDGSGIATVAVLQGIQDAYNSVFAAAAGANNQPTLAELQALGITGVTEEYLASVQAAIRATADSGAGIDTIAKLQGVVDTETGTRAAALAKISGAAGSNNAGDVDPTAADYAAAGATGVDANNLTAINSALNSAYVTSALANTTVEIQTIVDAYAAILAAADGTAGNGVAPTASQYTAIGVTEVTAGAQTSLLGSVIDGLASTAVDTVAEVQALADAVADLMAGAAGTANEPSLADLQALGITGVTSSNLAAVQAAIAATANDGTGVDSTSKLQAVVAGAVNSFNALATISGAAENNSATDSSPAASDYATAGVTGVTTNNLASINSVLNTGVNGAAIDSAAEVQTIVDSYISILGLADGSAGTAAGSLPAPSAYTLLGVTGLTGPTAAAQAGLLGSVIDEKATADVDRVSKIQALADAVQGVMAGAAGTANEPTLADLTALGVTGADATNLALIRAAIAGTADNGLDVDSITKLQALVDGVLNSISSALATISGAAENDNATATSPAASDYASAAVTGFDVTNLGAINSVLNSAAINGAAADTTAEIQTIVDAYNAILGAADGLSDGDTKPTLVQYTQIGVTGVSAGAGVELLGEVIDRKSGADVNTVAKVQALADAVKAVMDAANGVTGVPTLTQLQLLGVTGVTTGNLANVLAALAATADDGSGADSLSKLQTLVPVLIANDDSLARDGIPGSSTSIAVAQVLANDTFSSPSAPTVSLLSGTTAQGGAVTLDNGWFLYTSPTSLDPTVTDSFVYRITDSQGNTSDGTVYLAAGDYSAVAVNIVWVRDANFGTGKDVSFAVTPNKFYRIYATSSLVAPISWQDLGAGSVYGGGESGSIIINDSGAGSSRFYKLEEYRP